MRRFAASVLWEAILQFEEGLPADCPPSDAHDGDSVVFRAVGNGQIGPADFKSWVAMKHPSAKHGNCRHWGLSVWITVADVEHARSISNHVCEQYIAKGEIQKGDGLLGHTSTRPQPNHHTLWCAANVDISTRFKISMPPVGEEE